MWEENVFIVRKKIIIASKKFRIPRKVRFFSELRESQNCRNFLQIRFFWIFFSQMWVFISCNSYFFMQFLFLAIHFFSHFRFFHTLWILSRNCFYFSQFWLFLVIASFFFSTVCYKVLLCKEKVVINLFLSFYSMAETSFLMFQIWSNWKCFWDVQIQRLLWRAETMVWTQLIYLRAGRLRLFPANVF